MGDTVSQALQDLVRELRTLAEDEICVATREFERMGFMTGIAAFARAGVYLQVASRLEGLLPAPVEEKASART